MIKTMNAPYGEPSRRLAGLSNALRRAIQVAFSNRNIEELESLQFAENKRVGVLLIATKHEIPPNGFGRPFRMKAGRS
jgi:hypothetical protein